MLSLLGRLAVPLLHGLDAETAHGVTIKALKAAPVLPMKPDDPRLAVSAFGLTFPNPVGLAAGFDKNAEVPDAMLGLGFGFTEVGTLTPKPQAGNPKPRIFRLPADGAVINRLGFNNEGHAAGLRRLQARPGRPGIVGVNIGANKDSVDKTADYVAGIHAFAAVASYFTVNVSSPNTPGLRDLQHEAALDELLARVMEARDAAVASAGRKPVLLKIAPDVSLDELDGIVAVVRRRRVDGLIISNTTISRPASLRGTDASQMGGLSGRPLAELSTRVLAAAYLRLEGFCPLIGVGGVDSGETAWAKLEAGATLVQLYTGMVYRGPGIAGDIKADLLQRIETGRLASLAPVVGRRAAEFAAG